MRTDSRASNTSNIQTPPPEFRPALDLLGLEIPTTVLERLARYLDLLLSANQTMNLTAVRDPAEAWMRHLLDSLSLLPFLGDANQIVDVGSGGGLPGIPLAIVEPDRTFTLLEATGKKVRFLAETAEALGLHNVQAVQMRAEDAGRNAAYRERFDLVLARSVATLPALLEYLLPLARVHGRILAMKGAAAAEEVKTAQHAAKTLGAGQLAIHRTLPGIVDDATVVEAEKTRPTPKRYPRLPGVPRKEPLLG